MLLPAHSPAQLRIGKSCVNHVTGGVVCDDDDFDSVSIEWDMFDERLQRSHSKVSVDMPSSQYCSQRPLGSGWRFHCHFRSTCAWRLTEWRRGQHGPPNRALPSALSQLVHAHYDVETVTGASGAACGAFLSQNEQTKIRGARDCGGGFHGI